MAECPIELLFMSHTAHILCVSGPGVRGIDRAVDIIRFLVTFPTMSDGTSPGLELDCRFSFWLGTRDQLHRVIVAGSHAMLGGGRRQRLRVIVAELPGRLSKMNGQTRQVLLSTNLQMNFQLLYLNTTQPASRIVPWN